MKNRFLSILILLALPIFMFSCNEPKYISTLNGYMDSYNCVADKLGFEKASLSENDGSGVFGFAAFDGLFIVCIITDQSGNIRALDISTGSRYASEIKDEKVYNEALLSSAYLIAITESSDPDTHRISELAGMIDACLKSPLPFGDFTLSGKMLPSGGFEFTVE